MTESKRFQVTSLKQSSRISTETYTMQYPQKISVWHTIKNYQAQKEAGNYKP